jgi:outer membrane protein assembly factor BamB
MGRSTGNDKAVAGGALLSVALVMSAVLGAAEPKASPHWPQFRGPHGQGVSAEKGLPDDWSATRNVLWKTPIPGRGHSSPVVWGDRIFLTTAIEGEVVPGAKGVKHVMDGQDFVHPQGVGDDRRHTFKVLALDARDGRILWEKLAHEGLPYDTRHKRGSFASQTPVTDGKLVYAFFGSEGLLFAYELDGRLAWKANLGGIATVGVGFGTSPVLYGDVIILQCDEDNGDKSFITALDKKTGREVWRVARKVQVSWATPVLVRAGGRDELVTSGTEWIIAYAPSTGAELWRAKGLSSNAVPSPVVVGDVVVVSAGYPEKLAMGIRAGGSGDISDTPRVLWKYTKGTAYVPSPIAYGGYVYLVTDKGILTCLDARTGEVKYEGGRVPIPATLMASPVAYDGKILLSSMEGDTFVIKAGPVHEVLRTNTLGEAIAASPAISRGRIFIRGESHLYAIGPRARS